MKSIYKISKRLERIKKFLKILAYILVVISIINFIVGTGEVVMILPGYPLVIFLLIYSNNIYLGKEYLRADIFYVPISDIIKTEKIIEKNYINYRLTFKDKQAGYINVTKKYITKEAESLLDEKLSAVEKKRNTGFW